MLLLERRRLTWKLASISFSHLLFASFRNGARPPISHIRSLLPSIEIFLLTLLSAMLLLQKRRPTFNFANNLLQSLARRADAPVPAIANMALSGLRDTIISSPLNSHIKTCVELLAETVKKKQQRVNVQVLEVFLPLKSIYLSIHPTIHHTIHLSIYTYDTHTHTHTHTQLSLIHLPEPTTPY